ncbi:hypothetical protein H8356DRAFT_1356172 [Neocallimastix lanati (nom. inval.)]|nr:hypothetical protein H8356DRAFT_1356172 [Neocallimastix sp. JGI-2020a]
MTIFLTRGFHRIWWLVFQVNIIDTELFERVEYILLNCNGSDNYAITRELLNETLWVREITNWRSTRRSSTSKILINNMHIGAPVLKHSEVCDYLNINIPTAHEGG